MGKNRQFDKRQVGLPRQARLPINRCNLPAVILGSLTFQRHPDILAIDGVRELHRALFDDLRNVASAEQRALRFTAYMHSAFLLEHPDEVGLDPDCGRPRHRIDYRRLLRGWLFDSDSAEAAVLKGWVESRFGLLARKHEGRLHSGDTDWEHRYAVARTNGLYNTNALEAQLDLLFTYCQFELGLTHGTKARLRLYRGINGIGNHEILARPGHGRYVLVLNNLSSFSSSRERADEFGDIVIVADVPVSKLLYVPALLPGLLRGEDEFLVIGGVYEVAVATG
ncbi:MAG: NAD(+)--dinitrogen-reductase ADP-D-ribosyltransferase [Gammaproteobacteria bacterium]|nr:NAD(+)--dinitrogen-reductase ADP-D-ribosyltransferase [Gammaproteobacteria bacterium]